MNTKTQIKRFDFANTLRGFAALVVVFSHWFGVFWHNRSAVGELINAPALSLEAFPSPTLSQLIFAIPLFNWGAFGVALFFLVSGFVIPFSLNKSSLIGFAANRFLRIVPTYVVGFTITLAAVAGSSYFFENDWPFTLKEVLVHYIPGIRDVLWSKNIDSVVWTLEIEVKFYCICALLIAFFRRLSMLVFFAPICFFVLAVLLKSNASAWENEDIRLWQLSVVFITASQYIIYMFVGVVFHYIECGTLEKYKGLFLGGGLFSCFAYLGFYANQPIVSTYAFALLFFCFAFTFRGVFKSNRIFDFFADISYPVYIIHGVAGYAALRVLLELGVRFWVSFLIVSAGCLLLSWLLHKLVEQPSQKIAKKFSFKGGF
jgi:peptidoglycan/LPS O-acetylase OafA/YrhL